MPDLTTFVMRFSLRRSTTSQLSVTTVLSLLALCMLTQPSPASVSPVAVLPSSVCGDKVGCFTGTITLGMMRAVEPVCNMLSSDVEILDRIPSDLDAHGWNPNGSASLVTSGKSDFIVSVEMLCNSRISGAFNRTENLHEGNQSVFNSSDLKSFVTSSMNVPSDPGDISSVSKTNSPL